MALASTTRFGSFVVMIGDGAEPEVFSAPCGFTSKSWTRTKNMNETEVPDCDDPDAPSHVERDITALTASISGSGVMAQESLPMWREFYASNNSKTVKIIFPESATEVTVTQKYHLASFEVTAEKGSRAAVNVQLESDGAFAETVIP
ncbi:phage tail tube protein [Aurantimonas sp. 22II-16-19i]|uniref:phage tail tube protein n=1 Tax=Aurantimonas sp. 22II-16-19i TaxID=1317114 RepID=UPI0009F7A3EF|nr:phage tail tube protein [Aurantimonas sp. 22II-16-19i]ORE89744.1 hypothetical protein ATO4_23737 [Aurantimonas sp. 22II-16-19i]